jgi:hypothetical protein
MPAVQAQFLQYLVRRAHLPALQEAVALELGHPVAVEQPSGVKS